jgi:hypothetical protein
LGFSDLGFFVWTVHFIFHNLKCYDLGMSSSETLKPQDLYVALKYSLGEQQTYEAIAQDLGMDVAGVHRATKRAMQAGLLKQNPNKQIVAIREALEDFLIHGSRYAFFAVHGGITRGTPTAYAAPPLSELIVADGEAQPVWPDAHGTVRGYSINPLHKNAPDAARRDPRLYELLALTDAIRIGRARERKLAESELRKRFKGQA